MILLNPFLPKQAGRKNQQSSGLTQFPQMGLGIAYLHSIFVK